ncbi:MAG: 4-alpha-glucanotransferase [Solobacterium sp.]|nr:4-alpha-glucanotransferase [Solobacterium sp.]MBQ1321783.1 4-alpha-glucanotransferase [Solobacterium sp.]MBQ1356201.1 4-alpha-glucanotransferase [Solobacterium sp.]
MKRSAGILMPLSALDGPYGIGTMGRQARKFVDFLARAGQKYWQILPLGPTGYGDSPYSCFSSFAGNPYLIDLDLLADRGLLKKEEYEWLYWGGDPCRVDYHALYEYRDRVLRMAVARLLAEDPQHVIQFAEKEKDWLRDYALFMTAKKVYDGQPFTQWPDKLRRHDARELERFAAGHGDEIMFWQSVQYLFFMQWTALKQYAGQRGIEIIGDLPIYVSPDSVEAWSSPGFFQLDRQGKPKEVAGCPPDGFSADGQLWGNPLYNWRAMKKDGYAWWTARIRQQLRFYDVLRIDHFRGFAGYYAIPAGEETARNGVWKKGPGIDFFRTVEAQLPEMQIIAEDLGFLTPDVLEMLAETGYPGMKVLEFAFDPDDPDNEYLPHNFTENCIVYAGTHDNDTVQGWMANTPKESTDLARQYMGLNEQEGYHWGMIRTAYTSVAKIAVIQLQDFLGLGSEARMNTPSTLGNNWVWRVSPGAYTDDLADRIAQLTGLCGRLVKEETETEADE